MGIIYLRYMLLRQIEYLEKFQPELLELYSTKQDEKERFAEKLQKYMQYIEGLVSAEDDPLSYHPQKVIVNSKATLRNQDTEAMEVYTVCLPEHDGRDENFVSLTRPLGAKLLLASLHSTLHITTRGRKACYYIEKIEVLPMVAAEKRNRGQIRLK